MSDSMRKFLTIMEDTPRFAKAEPKFSQTKPGVYTREPDNDDVADLIWDDKNQGFKVVFRRGPDIGKALTQKLWMAMMQGQPHYKNTTLPQFGFIPSKREDVILFPERQDALKALDEIVPVVRSRGYAAPDYDRQL